MTPFSQNVLDDIFAHAREVAPQEACGLIVETETGFVVAVRSSNVSGDPEINFCVDPKVYSDASKAGKLVAVYHSHPNGNPDPSAADVMLRDDPRRARLPFLIVSPHLGTLTYTTPCYKSAPLVGRPWVPGVLDCYGLVRDYFDDRGIVLPDPFRGDWDYLNGWQSIAESPFKTYEAEARMVPVPKETMRESDVLLFRWIFDLEHHVGVYLGFNEMLHHPVGKISRKEVMGDVWLKRLSRVWRHESMMRERDIRET